MRDSGSTLVEALNQLEHESRLLRDDIQIIVHHNHRAAEGRLRWDRREVADRRRMDRGRAGANRRNSFDRRKNGRRMPLEERLYELERQLAELLRQSRMLSALRSRALEQIKDQ